MLVLCACGAAPEEEESLLERYRAADSFTMEAQITFGSEEQVQSYTLRCACDSDGTGQVEVVEPEYLAGLKASVEGENLTLTYADMVLPAGTLSSEELSPAMALPLLMRSLREGWLIEESREDWGETPCVRVCCDLTGENGGKLVSTVWLSVESGAPVHGEIAVDEEIILQAEFTDFAFGGTIEQELTQQEAS
nr:hypothetical protein [Dysosmobacter acutus]